MRIPVIVCCLTLVFSQAVLAEGNRCDHAALTAATETGVPVDVLMALTRTETGRKRDGVLQPWPWTVNMEGEGHWFASEENARAYVFKHFKLGARSFDVGCFQVNYKWHGEGFDSIEDMFDPIKNAVYAAKFLKSLKSQGGTWIEAAGAYHSKTPTYATKYKTRFSAIRDALSVPSVPAPEQKRTNGFPLLQAASEKGRFGSLVSVSHGTARPLFVKGEQG